MIVPQLPLAKLRDSDQTFPAHRRDAARSAVAAVPDGARVELDIGLMSWLVDRTEVVWIGNTSPEPDYIVLERVRMP
ncbi:hypothetical protein [Plantibacter sp. YIM 135347]|uniref:hypothetical protein n=1 Tax=Plantibacter sp. YIM 135347 TaxID=3423919 RepID=UPI003D34F391